MQTQRVFFCSLKQSAVLLDKRINISLGFHEFPKHEYPLRYNIETLKSSLSRVVRYIKRNYYKEYTWIVFLDIEGDFNYIRKEAIREAQ